MGSFFHIDGLHPPNKRYAFTNVLNREFVTKWNGNPIPVKSLETIEISDLTPIPGAGMGHTLAEKMLGEMVDALMAEENKANLAFIPAARKPYEERVLRELNPEEESPAIRALREELRQELMGQKPQPAVAEAMAPMEFENLGKTGTIETSKTPEAVKPALRTKKISEKTA